VPERRFPPPWSVEETCACYIVRDANGHALACAEDEPGRRTAAHLLTRDEARRIAANMTARRWRARIRFDPARISPSLSTQARAAMT
jgi:hypothetical protein